MIKMKYKKLGWLNLKFIAFISEPYLKNGNLFVRLKIKVQKNKELK
jgi:hypothetical protein